MIVFRSRVKDGADLTRLEALAVRMATLAPTMSGFVSYKDFVAEDGENVSVVEFDTHEHLAAWREHPEHRAAQRAAREEFFSSYRITVCDVVRETLFP